MKGKGWGNRGDCLGYGSGRWQRFDHCDCQALVGLKRWSRRLPTLALAVQQGRRGQQVIAALGLM